MDQAKILKSIEKEKQNEGCLGKAPQRETSRKAKNLKMKASKTDLSELLQIMMMKAYVVADEKKASSGGALSSTDTWTPADAKEAFEVVQEAVQAKQCTDVANFAEELLKNGSG